MRNDVSTTSKKSSATAARVMGEVPGKGRKMTKKREAERCPRGGIEAARKGAGMKKGQACPSQIKTHAPPQELVTHTLLLSSVRPVTARAADNKSSPNRAAEKKESEQRTPRMKEDQHESAEEDRNISERTRERSNKARRKEEQRRSKKGAQELDATAHANKRAEPPTIARSAL